MYGQGSASNNDKSLIEPSHDVASQLLTMGLTPAINDNDLLGCTHPRVYVDDKATSAVTEGFNVCPQSQNNYIMTSDFTEILTNSSDNAHSAPANCSNHGESTKKQNHKKRVVKPDIQDHLEKMSAKIAQEQASDSGRTKRKELLGITPIRALSGTWGDKIDGSGHFLWI
ncbi:hypothetical protein Tco_0786478 [Tanacetum coccineum]